MLINREVVTCEEIERKAIRAILRSKGVEALDISEEVLQEIKSSYVECPISAHSFHYSEEVEIENVKFYHLHHSKPVREDFEKAHSEFLISRRFLEASGKMKSVADKFFKDYKVSKGLIREYSKNNQKFAVFFSLLQDISEDLQAHLDFASKYSGEYMIVVPTEKTPKEFIEFFNQHSSEIKSANIKIWVADVDKESIDPFIGYPKDLKLLKRFKNPKLATHIESLWRQKEERID